MVICSYYCQQLCVNDFNKYWSVVVNFKDSHSVITGRALHECICNLHKRQAIRQMFLLN